MSLIESEGFDEYAGYKYMISAQYYFSKFIELGALKMKKAEEVSKWIYDNIIWHNLLFTALWLSASRIIIRIIFVK